MTRVLTYSIAHSVGGPAGPSSFGVLTPDGTGVVDLAARLPDVADLGALIAGPGLSAAQPFESDSPDHSTDEIVFERPVVSPSKIFCIGVNYGGRAAEYADQTDAAYPSVFPRFPDSFTGHRRDLIRPPESEQLDYEGEIVVVIGRGGRRIPMSNARDHIAGLTLGNEGTIRDWVRHAKFNVTQGKNWRASGAIGPWLIPIDEFGDLEQLHLTTKVNGEVRQDDTPASMKYSIPYQISYLSTFTELNPGDLIFSGTPTGAGARLDPPVWLQPGDVVEVEVPEIGTLSNIVADEFEAGTAGARRQPPPPQ